MDILISSIKVFRNEAGDIVRVKENNNNHIGGYFQDTFVFVCLIIRD